MSGVAAYRQALNQLRAAQTAYDAANTAYENALDTLSSNRANFFEEERLIGIDRANARSNATGGQGNENPRRADLLALKARIATRNTFRDALDTNKLDINAAFDARAPLLEALEAAQANVDAAADALALSTN
jgi:hypothetical protein